MNKTKRVFGAQIRLTKSGSYHSQDLLKLRRAYSDAISSSIKAWEFFAGIEGQTSSADLKQQSKTDYLSAIYNQLTEGL